MSKKLGHIEKDGIEYYPRPSFPIGFIIIANREINPSEEFGGVWEIYSLANGRTLVGVDPNDNDFKTPEKIGGSKKLHKHSHGGTTSESGWHTHSINWWLSAVGGNGYCVEGWRTRTIQGTFDANWSGTHTHSFTTSETGTGNSENLQPYITVYFYIRVA